MLIKVLPIETEQLPARVIDFMNYLKSMKGASDNTIVAYSMDLTIFLKFIKAYRRLVVDVEFEDIDITDIDDSLLSTVTEDEIMIFVNWIQSERDNTNSTRARKIACLKSFFRYLNKKAKIMDYNPAMEMESPKIGKRKPIYLSLDESLSLLHSVSSRNTVRDLCIITLFLNCGLRLSELCSINIGNIREEILTIIGKGNKERKIPLNSACVKTINEYLPVRAKALEGYKISDDTKRALFISERRSRIKRRTVQDLVEKYIALAGLKDKHYTTHKLRHTAASLMYQNGADIISLHRSSAMRM
jgi:site-specific recombinase XerD